MYRTNLIHKAIMMALMAVLFSTTGVAQQSPWSGMRIAFLGDSMTDPNNTSADCKYWRVMQDSIGVEPLVYAVSGYRWHNMMRMAQKLNDEHGQDVDAIFIWCGTNDFNGSVPVGNYFTEDTLAVNVNGEMTERKHRNLDFTEGTVSGEFNTVMSYLKSTYPTKQIVVLTPIHRGYANFSEHNIQPEETYANGQGLYIDDYVDVIKRGCQIWAVPVIDLFKDSGLLPGLTSNDLYVGNPEYDRLHPNNAGHLRIAQTVIAALNAISPLR